MLGMQGAEPLAKNNFGLPLPAGKGVGGIGGRKALIRQTKQARQDTAPAPLGADTAGQTSAAGGLILGMQGAKPLA